jgi:hypothetical protein
MFRLDRLERFALAKIFPLIPSQAMSWLFGSRTDVSGRGGDIDILIQIDASPQERFELSHRLTLAFQEHCDEEIDFVVVPKSNDFLQTEPAQEAFLRSIVKPIDLEKVVNTPLLDHVALLVRSLENSRVASASLGFAVQEIQSFPETIETYIGEAARSSRLLLMQASGPGSYQRALEKRGPGVHHLGVVVPSMKKFLSGIKGTGWFIHPVSAFKIESGGDVYLARPGAPLLEVSEAEPCKPALLAPVVERVHIRVSPEVAANLSCLGIPELAWTTTEESAIQVGGKWRQVAEFI